MKGYVLLCILLLPLFLGNAQGSYTNNSDEALKAAEDFETAVFSSIPKAKKFISYFDIDSEDGHLMVVTKNALLRADEKSQNEVYKTLRDMWRRTIYVRRKKYAGWVEILSPEGKTILRVKQRLDAK